MRDDLDDLARLLKRRFADQPSLDDIPEREILDALIEWLMAGRPPPRISVSYHGDGSVTIEKSLSAAIDC